MNINITQALNNAKIVTVSHSSGQLIQLFSIGASLLSWKTPKGVNIVAGYDSLEDYLSPGMYLGTNVGLVAGRIENSSFRLNDKFYQIKTQYSHLLHGGEDSIAFKNFDVHILSSSEEETTIEFSLLYQNSQLPGKQKISIQYHVQINAIKVVFNTSTTEPTMCNITNHSYFNLDGSFNLPMENYLLTIPASKVVLVNDQMIGKQIVDVKGTPFDFVNTSNLLESIQKIESTGIKARGIDHYFVFDTSSGKNKITLESLSSKRKLSLITTYPGVTIYTANYPTLKSINNHQILVKHGAICLEAQYQSNAINDERFSLGFVTPDSPYHHEIEYLLEE